MLWNHDILSDQYPSRLPDFYEAQEVCLRVRFPETTPFSTSTSFLLHTNPGLMCLSSIYLKKRPGAQHPCHISTALMAHHLQLHVRLFFAQLGGAPGETRITLSRLRVCTHVHHRVLNSNPFLLIQIYKQQ